MNRFEVSRPTCAINVHKQEAVACLLLAHCGRCSTQLSILFKEQTSNGSKIFSL